MSRRSGRGGARTALKPRAVELPPPVWIKLMSSLQALMQLIADEIAESDELEDVYGELMERVGVLDQVKRKKQAFEQRIELLEMLAVADLLTLRG